MLPGFVTTYKDINGFIHLYFYPGIDKNNNYYYRTLDLSKCNIKYTEIENSDKSKEYIFENKNILKIVCTLIDNNNKIHKKELVI